MPTSSVDDALTELARSRLFVHRRIAEVKRNFSSARASPGRAPWRDGPRQVRARLSQHSAGTFNALLPGLYLRGMSTDDFQEAACRSPGQGRPEPVAGAGN
jgi:hypothetical protein